MYVQGIDTDEPYLWVIKGGYRTHRGRKGAFNPRYHDNGHFSFPYKSDYFKYKILTPNSMSWWEK